MTSAETPVPAKTCTCDDKFIVFMKSKQFETIIKDAMQNAMGEIIRNILKHQIRDDLTTIIGKIEKMDLDLKCLTSKYGMTKNMNGEGNGSKDKECHANDDDQNSYINQNSDDDDDDEETFGINNDNTNSYRDDDKENNGHGKYKLVFTQKSKESAKKKPESNLTPLF